MNPDLPAVPALPGLLFVDDAGCVTAVTAAAAELAGLPPETCVGRPLAELFPPDRRGASPGPRHRSATGRAVHLCRSALAAGAAGATIVTVVPADAALPVVDPELDAALRRGRAMLARTERIAEIGSWEWDVAGDRLSWSDGLFRLLGVDPAEGPPSFASAEFYEPEEYARVQRVVERALRTREPFELEVRARRRDGALRTFRARGEFLEAGPEAGPRLVGSWQDVTALRLAESDRDRYRLAIEQVRDPILICGPEGEVRYANAAAEAVLGRSAAVLGGTALEALAGERTDPEALAGCARALREGRPWSGRLEDWGPGLTVELSLSPVVDPAGAAGERVAIVRDVGPRLELERRVRQAQKLESVGRLAGGIAHDFNNALQSILGNTELALAEAEPGGELEELLADVRASARHAAELTRKLLAFAREQRVAPRRLELAEVLPPVLELLRRGFGADVHLEFRSEPGLGPVRIDPAQLEQLVTNLCLNARDALGGAGRIEVSVAPVHVAEAEARTVPGRTAGDYLRLRVADEGCGMDEEVLAHVFEPFFTTKAVGRSSGLGLATVYGIVQQNGGAVEVRSRPGEGTVFDVWLPRCSEAEPGGAAASELPSDA
ncbi:MAG: ATP-binding protein [Pseudomonadales bacterium]|nr:ATP-binding protein [Pseudomonadales bacterium]